MNSSTFCCSLFLGLILISQLPLSANARELLEGGLVDELCNSIQADKITCHSVLGSNPEAMKAKNYKQLTKAVLTMGIAKAVAGQTFLKGLAAITKSPALTRCANFDYDGVVGSFKSALGEIKEDTQTASYDAAVSIDGPTTCDRGLEAEHFVNPQVTALNHDIFLVCQMASYATNKL